MTAVNPLGTKFTIPFTNTKEYNQTLTNECVEQLKHILESGTYILGNPVVEFENTLCSYIDMPYGIGVGSGTSALELAFESLNLSSSDEVIIQANAYIACALGAIRSSAQLRVIDCDENGCFSVSNLKTAVSSNTKAVLVVHLYGDSCDMDAVSDICKSNNMFLIEDCAQSFGSCWNTKKLGSFGDISCHSFYPTKNLGAIGDAGAILCKSESLANVLRKMRNLGSTEKYVHSIIGTNSRMDALQASFLSFKIGLVDNVIKQKRQIANFYTTHGLPHIYNNTSDAYHSYHLYVISIDNRDSVSKTLASEGIETLIHYPIPFYKSNAFKNLNNMTFRNTEYLASRILSIPIHTSIHDTQQRLIVETVLKHTQNNH
jgi:dTDP-4-amino-4,6-dideoxygalactose transaminase